MRNAFAALMLITVSCTTHIDVGAMDSGPIDAGRDAAPDAFHLLDGGPLVDAHPSVWGVADCFRAAREGQSGDACEPFYCAPADPGASLVPFAFCDMQGRLSAGTIECLECHAPASAPWVDCDAALQAGAAGQACSGEWACAGRSEGMPCCVEIAACGGRADTSRIDVLGRTRICLRACEQTLSASRPTWNECPGTRTSTADPEPLPGDPCTGDWACIPPIEAFAGGLSPGLTQYPTWCADGILHLAPQYACFWSPPACTE